MLDPTEPSHRCSNVRVGNLTCPVHETSAEFCKYFHMQPATRMFLIDLFSGLVCILVLRAQRLLSFHASILLSILKSSTMRFIK